MFRTSYSVEQTITINAPASRIWKHLATFQQQSQWSPWLIMEPDTPLTFPDKDGVTGARWSWNGQRIGSGEQTILSINPERSLTTSISFFTPWKSYATSGLFLEAVDDQTTIIRWTMNSDLPLFAFRMKKKLVKCVKDDFRRGLMLLQALVEDNTIATQSIYDGEVDGSSITGIGIANRSSKTDMATIMGDDFATLLSYCKTHQLPITGGFTLYTKTDIINETFEFVGCLATDIPKDHVLPDGIDRYTTSAGKHLRVTHKGDYTYLENSRSTLYGAAMALKKKINKKLPAYEKYVIGPSQNNDPTTWITEIYLPLK